MKNRNLELVVFICGAAVMAVELLGSRLLSPYMGNSIYTWASLIAVVLGALSLGYWAGGKAADRGPRMEVLGVIVLGAAVATAAIIPLSSFAGLSFYVIGARFGPLLACIIVFSVPSFLFGMVSPYAIRIRAEKIGNVGSTAGNLYAISTAGSIAGTLLAGFVLIPSFGVKALVLGTSVATLVAALLCFWGLRKAAMISLLLIAASSLFPAYPEMPGTVYAKDSEYYLIRVVDSGEDRYLLLDTYFNSGENRGTGEPVFRYTNCSLAALEAMPNPGSVLFIGLGGGTMPKYFARNTNASPIDAMEIDREVVAAADEYFGFNESGKVRVLVGDGRVEMRKLGRYDMIYVDVFNSFSMPYHLTTMEAAAEMKTHLNPNGILVMNIISAPEGPASGFFKAEYKTYASVFRNVYALPVEGKNEDVQNIIMLASDWDIPVENFTMDCVGNYIPDVDLEDAVLLTDDFAPTESLMAEVYAQR